MKAYRLIIIIIFFFSLFAFKAKATDQSTLIKQILQSTQQRYAPDMRTAVFNVSYRQTKTGIVLFGEVDSLAAKNTLIDILRKKLLEEVIDSIRILPDPIFENSRNGIIRVNVGDIRREPHKQGELLSQVLMGTIVKLLKNADGYYFIQMPDRYLGWIDTTALCRIDQNDLKTWSISPKVIITELKCIVRKTPDSASVPLDTLVAGCVLKSGSKNNTWTIIELGDQQKGFVLNSLVQDLDTWNKNRILTGEHLEKTARTFLGIPYLWGGTSVKGMDCSGFIKMVYRLHGVELHRDADQQAEQGTHIDPGKNFKNLKKGDLLFFGQHARGKQPKHITHVALSLGGKLFIHSAGAGQVRLGSFDPSSKYFEESLLKLFTRARRIIQKELVHVH